MKDMGPSPLISDISSASETHREVVVGIQIGVDNQLPGFLLFLPQHPLLVRMPWCQNEADVLAIGHVDYDCKEAGLLALALC